MPLRKFLLDKTEKRKYRLDGVVPSTQVPQKAKDFSCHINFSAPQLPPKVDLRSQMTPVEDQSTIGSCVANSLAGSYEYLLKQTSDQDIDVSRLFIYYNARVKKNGANNIKDSGCNITSAIESLQESGVCLESIWPYDTKKVNKRPSDEAYEAAESNTIADAFQLEVDLHEMKSCLAQGFPFVFGLKLFKSFENARKKGIVPAPKSTEDRRESHGSHAMLAVGYSDQSKAFIVRNSWGPEWGDKGYCYIPYDYLANKDLAFDPWAIRQLETDDMGHEGWDEEDETNYQQDEDDDDDDDDGYDIDEEEEEEEEEEDDDDE